MANENGERHDGRKNGAMIFGASSPRAGVTLVLVLTALIWLIATDETQAGLNQWTSSGPAGGFANLVTIDLQTPTTLYVSTGSGIFKSTNGGGNWTSSNTGLEGFIPDALVIDPLTPTTLYAAGFAGVF